VCAMRALPSFADGIPAALIAKSPRHAPRASSEVAYWVQASQLRLRVSAESQPKRNASILHRLSCHHTRIVNQLYNSSDCQRLKHCAAGASAEEAPVRTRSEAPRTSTLYYNGRLVGHTGPQARIGTLQTSYADGGDVGGLNLQAVACPAGRPPVMAAFEAR